MTFDFIGLLTFAVFLALKLAHTIAWPWWQVCIPLYFVALMYVSVYVISAVVIRKAKKHLGEVADDLMKGRFPL